MGVNSITMATGNKTVIKTRQNYPCLKAFSQTVFTFQFSSYTSLQKRCNFLFGNAQKMAGFLVVRVGVRKYRAKEACTSNLKPYSES
jgi:hypothetical protein